MLFHFRRQGSMTTSPGSVNIRIRRSSKGTGFCVGCTLGVSLSLIQSKQLKIILAILVELGQLIPVQQYPIFTIANDFHICFQHLCGKVLSENKVDVMVKTISFAKFYVFELLFKLAKHNHARGFPRLFRLFYKHLRTKVHKFSRAKILVRIEKLLTSLFRFSVFVIPIDIPCRITCISIDPQIIRRVGND